jgi:hypothetical protein
VPLGVESIVAGQPATRNGNAEVLASLASRIDPAEVAQRMVTTFRSEIPGYARMPTSVLGGQILGIAKTNVELFLRLVREGRQPAEQDLAPFRESARNRAEEGLPLEDLLHAYRLGGRLAWRSIVDAAGPDEQVALLEVTELLMGYVDVVSATVAQAYLDERQHVVSEEERRHRMLIDALVHPEREAPDLAVLADRAGIEVEELYRPFAQTMPGEPRHVHSQRAAELRARGILALTEGDRVAGLAPQGAAHTALARSGCVLLLGEPTSRARLAGMLDDARRLLELVVSRGNRGAVPLDDLVAERVVLRAPEIGESLTEAVFGPLDTYDAQRGSNLAETLTAYLASGLDRRRTANALHLHPNSVDYRIKKAAELTGFEPGRPGDLVKIQLAVAARDLGGG